jgi:very-short-patch-repair endonuclease
VDSRSVRAWRLARAQHGVVTRAQLLGLGFSKSAIENRLRTGRLLPVGRGVYLVGWDEWTDERRWTAAVLVCGPEAFLSHRSAAALMGVGEEVAGRIDVSVRRHCKIRRAGIHVKERPRLRGMDVGRFRGIHVTSPPQTFVDIATELASHRLERAVNEADKRDLIDPDSLRAALDDYVGQPGVKLLRTVLDRHTFRLSDTDLELLFRPIAESAGLSVPLTKQVVNGFEVDFYWPDLGLVIETDGWRYHRTPAAQSRDALRDQIHTASGLTPLRFSHYQVKYEPGHVRGVLGRTAARLRR